MQNKAKLLKNIKEENAMPNELVDWKVSFSASIRTYQAKGKKYGQVQPDSV